MVENVAILIVWCYMRDAVEGLKMLEPDGIDTLMHTGDNQRTAKKPSVQGSVSKSVPA
ncbi:MAG: hypothetical protein JWM58_2867 [Rhizobium sp.]|nr:hypothetical protein [Rhizobium sp.]